jgi:hypothetical protein
MQPLDRDKLQAVLTDGEIDQLQELLARRLSLCDGEPSQLARRLDQEIEALIGNRKSKIWEALAK